MVWGAIEYNMRSCLLRIEGNLNNNRYIREVLQPKILPLLQATLHAIFQQDNAQPHVARIVNAFFQIMGITAFLACTFTRHVAHRTCLGYGWSVTYSSGSTSTYSWRIVDSHTNCMEGHSQKKISRASLIPCHDAKILRLQHLEDSHHIEITCSQTMYSSVILIVCLSPCT